MFEATSTSLPHAGVESMPAASSDLDAMLGDFARQNPNLAWLPQMLAMQRQRAAEANTEAPGENAHLVEIDTLNEQLDQAQARYKRLQRLTRRLVQDLEDAQGLLADLAAAFGACGLCWGQDAHCPSCRGRGKPGRFAPDPELRLRFFTEPLAVPAASRSSTPPDPSERR